MLFCTSPFVVFALCVFVLYWSLPWRSVRVYLLLIASFYFYATWNASLALVVAGSSLADYLLARGMDATASNRLRKLLVGISIVGNLGLLCYFKYANFFLDSFTQMLRGAGLEVSTPTLNVLIPIGISFYTFEAISYTLDVYRKRIPAERNPANFLLFITFFPHMIAGPIVRAKAFLPQIRRKKRWNWHRAQVGVGFLVMGVIKKMAIGDRMAEFADPVFADPTLFGSTAIWAAIFAYSIQIYCDFSGYSDLAMGVAHLFGYTLTFNFDMPYASANVSEFWRRWHISLSSWLRDYLFIPLGGSRGSEWLTARNLLITMTLGGLWHGASWNFVVWGVVHGLFLILHRLFRPFAESRPIFQRCLTSLPGTLARVGVTFLCVSLAWVLFRATTLETAGEIYSRAFRFTWQPMGMAYWSLLGSLLAVVLFSHLVGRSGLWTWCQQRLPAPLIGVGYALGIALGMTFAPDAGKVFIYFQF